MEHDSIQHARPLAGSELIVAEVSLYEVTV
jgi:hypothetical protein